MHQNGAQVKKFIDIRRQECDQKDQGRKFVDKKTDVFSGNLGNPQTKDVLHAHIGGEICKIQTASKNTSYRSKNMPVSS